MLWDAFSILQTTQMSMGASTLQRFFISNQVSSTILFLFSFTPLTEPVFMKHADREAEEYLRAEAEKAEERLKRQAEREQNPRGDRRGGDYNKN